MEVRANTATGWLYRVFESATPEIVNLDESVGVYLRNRASVRFLQRFFDPLYEPYGIGICTSDDEIIEEPLALRALCDAIQEAIREAERKPETWSEVTGYTFQPFQTGLGDPIEETAFRESLVSFLREALATCETALRNQTHLIWAGGE